jgi:drug/metabolite transporter (DMT)-like permease
VSAEPDHLPQRLWWVLAALTLAWGFNWTALKVALSEVPPWTFRSFCLGLGAAVLCAALRAGGQRVVLPRRQWGRLWALALLNITSWNMLVAFGVAMIPSGRAAILAYTMPVWAVPLSVWLLGERITGAKLAGLVLGLGGLALLLAESFAGLGRAPLGALLVVGAAVSWALGTVLQKRYPVNLPVGVYTAWIMLLGGVPIFAGALVFEDWHSLARGGNDGVARHRLQRVHRLCLRALGVDQDRHLGAGERVFDQHAAHPGGRRGERDAVSGRASDLGRVCGAGARPRGPAHGAAASARRRGTSAGSQFLTACARSSVSG